MKSIRKFSDVDSAIKGLQDLKKDGKNATIIICTVDFDNDEESREMTIPDKGCILVKKSKTIIINEDEYIPHIELYSVVQNDLENIIKRGIMHDIIFHKRD